MNDKTDLDDAGPRSPPLVPLAHLLAAARLQQHHATDQRSRRNDHLLRRGVELGRGGVAGGVRVAGKAHRGFHRLDGVLDGAVAVELLLAHLQHAAVSLGRGRCSHC